MIKINLFIQVFLIISFLFYGLACFFSKHIFKEFQRYGLSKWRHITGFMQIIASFGFLTGFYLPYLTAFAALLLSIIMLVAFIVRMKIRDSILLTTPAILYLLLSFFILISELQLIK